MAADSKPETLLHPGIAVDGHGALSRRVYAEPPHPYRTPFARDAARILHARAFRRLAGKTQVFNRLPGNPPGDHFRSRLTHTLEVTQISRTVAHALGLNAELAEALALTHDIGHPPFGHAGEAALDHALQAHGLGFDHNLHALRIVTWFEERYAAFRGLNLTLGVREGIVKHSRDYSSAQHPELAEYFLDQFPPLEAQLIDLADEIAYLTADLDDGLGSGILTLEQVREGVALFRLFHDAVRRDYPAAPPKLAAHETLKRILNALVTDLLEEVRRQVAALGLDAERLNAARTDGVSSGEISSDGMKSVATGSSEIGLGWVALNGIGLDEIRRAPHRLATLSPEMEASRAAAKQFLYANLYNSPGMGEAHTHASQVVEELFSALIADPGLLPTDHQAEIPAEGLVRTVADYIAGMTDSYIEQAWQRCAKP